MTGTSTITQTLTVANGLFTAALDDRSGKGVIASRLNLTQEHFSRILHELSESGLITVDGRTIRIPSGLAEVEASLATNLLPATPTEQVMPCSSNTRARRCSPISAASPRRRPLPDTSKYLPMVSL